MCVSLQGQYRPTPFVFLLMFPLNTVFRLLYFRSIYSTNKTKKRGKTSAGLLVRDGRQAIRPHPSRVPSRQRGAGVVSRPGDGTIPWAAARVVRRMHWPLRRPNARYMPSGLGVGASSTPWDRGRFLKMPRTPIDATPRRHNTDLSRVGDTIRDMRRALPAVYHRRKVLGLEP